MEIQQNANPMTIQSESQDGGYIISQKIFKKNSQIFAVCEGSPKAILPFAVKYWNGINVIPLDDKIRKKISNFTNTCDNSDTFNSVFGFKLLPEDLCNLYNEMTDKIIHNKQKDNCDDLKDFSVELIDLTDEAYSFFYSLIQNLVLVGVLGLSFEPKEDISAFIDDLEQAGIGFVYFSPYDQKSTKAFGERLGLDTDWNSCILLNKPNPTCDGKLSAVRGYSDLRDINARLPQGPQQIRHHLENVDDIALHVSLFSNSYDNMGIEIKELFKIFNEPGETVCLVGNCLNSSNFFLFRNADVAIGMEPSYAQDSDKSIQTPSTVCNSMYLANILVSTFSSLDGLPFKSSPYILTEIIREGRSLLDVSFQIISYILVVSIAFSIYCAISNLAMHNLWGIIPVIVVSIAFLGNTHDQNIMRFMPAKKNEDETKIYLFNPKRLVSYFLIKCFSNVL